MSLVVTVLHIMVCVFLIAVVLLQRGKGADIGAVFGGGASSTVFGSRGAGSFLTKLTTGAAILFMATSLFLSFLGSRSTSESLLEGASPTTAPAPAPAPDAASPFQETPQTPPASGAAPSPAAEAPKAEAPAPAPTPAKP